MAWTKAHLRASLEVSNSFQGVVIGTAFKGDKVEELHCMHRCSHLRGLYRIEKCQRCDFRELD